MAQFKSATSGNVTAEIWWGKQHLKQTDRQDVTSGGATLTLHEVLTGAIANGCNDDTDDE
ncbi:MAG TPA: hypothetical protein PK093_24835 [Phycisphaerae bacterium]|nr:hypothetical protein [Phycisphaerae bacterium]